MVRLQAQCIFIVYSDNEYLIIIWKYLYKVAYSATTYKNNDCFCFSNCTRAARGEILLVKTLFFLQQKCIHKIWFQGDSNIEGVE